MDREKFDLLMGKVKAQLTEDQVIAMAEDIQEIEALYGKGEKTLETLSTENAAFTETIKTVETERDDVKKKFYERFINGSIDVEEDDTEDETPPIETKKSLDEMFGTKV